MNNRHAHFRLVYKYGAAHYRLVGIADIISKSARNIVGPRAATYQPQSSYFLAVYRRVNGQPAARETVTQ